MSVQPPNWIKLTCRVEGAPVPGVLLSLTLRMRRKNDFGMFAGPTDALGTVRVTWEEIVRWAQMDRNTFPMDYTGLGDFTGELLVRPLSREDLDAALRAYQLFHESVAYPPGYLGQLEAGKESLVRSGLSAIWVEVEHDGQGLTVRTAPAKA